MKKLIVLFSSYLIFTYCQAQDPDDLTTPVKENNNTVKAAKTPSRKKVPKESTTSDNDLIDVTFNSGETFYLGVDGKDYGKIMSGEPKTIKLAAKYHRLYFESAETGETLKRPFDLNKEIAKDKKYTYQVPLKHNLPQRGKPVLKDSFQRQGGKLVESGNNGGNPQASSTMLKKGNEKERATVAELAADMRLMPVGSFYMGSEKVTITPFYMGKYEVTQQQWDAIMGYNNSSNKGCSDCPVENVSWKEVDSFIRKINSISSKIFRLPTEAEYEYVATKALEAALGNPAGSKVDQKKFIWFLSITGWYNNNAKSTQPVGTRQPFSGIFDLFGNVAEWCTELPSGSKNKGLNNLLSMGSRERKIVKGGSYKDAEDRLRPQFQDKKSASAQEKTIGFRLVMKTD